MIKNICMGCGSDFEGEEPKMCCSGRDCGCMGMPIDPVVCSEQCYDVVMNRYKQPEAPTLSRNIEDEARLWGDKNKEEMKKVNKDMMELGMSCYKKDKDGNVTRIDPLSDEANDLWNK